MKTELKELIVGAFLLLVTMVVVVFADGVMNPKDTSALESSINNKDLEEVLTAGNNAGLLDITNASDFAFGDDLFSAVHLLDVEGTNDALQIRAGVGGGTVTLNSADYSGADPGGVAAQGDSFKVYLNSDGVYRIFLDDDESKLKSNWTFDGQLGQTAWYTNSYSSTNITFDCDDGMFQKVTLTNNAHLTFTNALPCHNYSLQVFQDATGSRLLTYDGAIDWGTDGAPTLTTTATNMDIEVFIAIDAGWLIGNSKLGFTER